MASLAENIKSSAKCEEALKKLLAENSGDSIRDAVISLIQSSDASSTLHSVLSSLHAEPLHAKQLHVFRTCVEALKNDSVDAPCARDVTGILLMQVSWLPADSVARLTLEFVSSVSRGESLAGRWFELLPRLLSSLAQFADLEYDGVPQSGLQARADALAALCRAQWHAASATRLLEVLRDQRLAAAEVDQLLEAAEQLLKRVEYTELPPLVYQLVRLCSGPAAATLLQLLLEYFSLEEQRVRGAETEVDERAARSLRQAEGTVIYHITHAPSSDGGLVREFTRHVKASVQTPGRLLTPFCLALALALAAGETHAPPVLEGLVAAICRAERERSLRKESRWLANTAPCSVDAEELLLRAAELCATGWAPAGDGLLSLSFALLAAGVSSGGDRLAALGARTLTALVRRRPELARDAVSRLVSSVAGGGSAAAHVDALAQLITGCPLSVAESRGALTELLSHLGLLPLPTARRLLSALLPVLKICVPLKDTLVLTLRKLLVGKRCGARQTAVCGLLLCLRHFRVTGSLPFSQASQNFSCAMSQVAADLSQAFPTSANEALCLELLGVLRRCLTQQAAVRDTLYAGLHEVLSRNPELAESVLTMLQQQLETLLETRPAAPPLVLSRCIQVSGDDVTLSEPVPGLLASLAACSRRILSAADTDDTEDDGPELVAARLAEKTLDKIARGMMNVDIEDYDVGKESEIGGASVDGRRNAFLLQLLQGVYQALMDHRLQADFQSDEAAATVVTCLHEKYVVVTELLAKKTTAKGKKKEDRKPPGGATQSGAGGRPRQSREPSHQPLCLSLRSVTGVLSALTADAAPGHQMALRKLREAPDLVKHAADAARQLCGQLATDGECAGAEGCNTRHLVEHACKLAPALLKLAVRAADDDESLASSCLDALADLLDAFEKHFPEPLPSLLESVDAEGCAGLLSRCRLLVDAGCDARLLPALQRLILSSAHRLSADQQSQLVAWTAQLLKSPPSAEDGVSGRQLVELSLSAADRLSAHSTLARQLARALHEKLGDLDDEVRLTAADVQLTVVTERNGAACLLTLCSHLSGWLDWLDWVLAGCRAAASAALSEADAAREAAVCGRLLALLMVLDELVQTAVPLGPDTDATLKLAGRAYVSLAAVVKYYAARSRLGRLTRDVMCNKFERVVELCGRQLTPHVYTFITFTEAQQRQQRPSRPAGGDPAGKKARVLRQTRLIPLLVCNVEQFEKHLIALAKRTKLDLCAGLKLSTSRDFRINQATLQAALERAASSEEDGDENDDPAAGATPPAAEEGAVRSSQHSQVVSRLARPSQRVSKLSRGASQHQSQPSAKRPRLAK